MQVFVARTILPERSIFYQRTWLYPSPLSQVRIACRRRETVKYAGFGSFAALDEQEWDWKGSP
jgi:hypothetical protein